MDLAGWDKWFKTPKPYQVSPLSADTSYGYETFADALGKDDNKGTGDAGLKKIEARRNGEC